MNGARYEATFAKLGGNSEITKLSLDYFMVKEIDQLLLTLCLV